MIRKQEKELLNSENTSNLEEQNKRFKLESKDELKVKLMSEEKTAKCKVNPLLPQPPFLLTFIAPRKSGKTNCLVDLLTDELKFCKVFDYVWIWSKSFYHDSKWRNIAMDDPKNSVREDYNPQEIAYLWKRIQENSKEKKRNLLWVFDDMIDQNIMSPLHFGVLESIAVRGRHYGLSVVIVTQLYKKLSSAIRTNATNMVLYRIRNNNELHKIMEENQEALSKKEFLELINFCTKEPYSFMHINSQETDPRRRFRKNWNDVIILP